MIKLSIGKKLLLESVNPWFEKNGYTFLDRGDGRYQKDNDEWIFTIMFNFFENSMDHFNTTVFMHSKEVESMILKIGHPTIKMESYRKGENLLFTIQDLNNTDTFLEKIKLINLNNIIGYEQWGKLIIHYMENEGAAFINTYSYLPNVLNRLNELEDQGEKNYLKILLGGIDHLFRALIISRLCNDPRYNDKIARFDSIILQPKYEKWHSYYHKLKEELKSKDPIYNVGL